MEKDVVFAFMLTLAILTSLRTMRVKNRTIQVICVLLTGVMWLIVVQIMFLL